MKRTVGGIALVALLLIFARHVEWREIVVAMRSADWLLLLLAVVLNLLSLACKGVRWWVFLRAVGVESLALVMRATFAGAAINNLVIAQGGEGARVLIVSRASGVPALRVTSALVLERVLDGVSYVALVAGACWLLDVPPALARWRIVASVVLGVAIAVLLVVSRARARDLSTPGRLGAGTALSALAWGLQVATYFIVARAAHLEIGLGQSIAAQLAIGLSFLVRATPGNVGIFQAAYALALRPFGIAEGVAVGAALLIQAVQVLPVLLAGALASLPLPRPSRLSESGKESQNFNGTAG